MSDFAEDREERRLLERVLDFGEGDGRLSAKELQAFESMRGQQVYLTARQAMWIGSVAERLRISLDDCEIVTSSRNIFSELPPEQQAEELAQVRTVMPWEQAGYVKPLKPPGRAV